jgi:predicted negative regulator of RcsB-dependent stress response
MDCFEPKRPRNGKEVIFLLAFSSSYGMISRFMSSETKPPGNEGAQRGTDVYDLIAWLEVNKKRVGIVAVVLVLIGFGLAVVRHLKQEKESKASTELLALRPTLTPATNVVPPQASALQKVADNFPGTSAAERARILAATTHFTEGKYAEAEAEFSRFLKDLPDSPWTASAAFGVAAAQEAQNKGNEALTSYQTVIAAHANSPLAADAKLALARIYESRNQPDQALRLYNELLAPVPGARPGELPNPEAQEHKEALLRAHPALSTNNVVHATVPPQSASVPGTNAAPTQPTNAVQPAGTNAPITAAPADPKN